VKIEIGAGKVLISSGTLKHSMNRYNNGNIIDKKEGKKEGILNFSFYLLIKKIKKPNLF